MRQLEPRKQPTQVRAELTRERILTAAAHVFAEYGYAAGTTNRIAERARVSIGSLYQYFPNKDAILASLLVRHLDAGMAAQRDSGTSASLESIVRQHVRSAIDNHQEDPQLLRLLIEQAPFSPELIRRMEAYQERRVAEIGELLASHPEVRVTDTATAAQLIVASVEMVVHQLVVAQVDADRLENELTAMLTRYLTSTP